MNRWVTLVVMAALASVQAHADRTILAPNGDTLAPNTFRSELAIDPTRRVQDRIWLQYSTPEGLELETERLDLAGNRKIGYAFNVQYPITVQLVRNLPAISVGVRDLTGTGDEHGAFYLSATRDLGLSDTAALYLRDFRITVGAGTGRIGGLFGGIETRLRTGLSLRAEIYRRRANVTVALPVTRNIDVRAYSLDSRIYYGVSFTVLR